MGDKGRSVLETDGWNDGVQGRSHEWALLYTPSPQHSNPDLSLPSHNPPGSREYSKVQRIKTKIPSRTARQSESTTCNDLMNEEDVPTAAYEAYLQTAQISLGPAGHRAKIST